MNGLRIKICGITRREDALWACEAGADALGFVFVEASPRYVRPDHAADLIAELPPFVTPVGVFVNETRERIRDIVRTTGIRALQLHGEESPEETLGYSVPVIKGFRVRTGFDAALLDRYPAAAHLLDAFSEKAHGGTGLTFDWAVAAGAARSRNIVLSGGLRPENVAAAVLQVRPYAVDTSSGVESSPGIKDKQRVKEFVANARDAGRAQ
jgi:phosphoribosylanthranilate isomerase